MSCSEQHSINKENVLKILNISDEFRACILRVSERSRAAKTFPFCHLLSHELCHLRHGDSPSQLRTGRPSHEFIGFYVWEKKLFAADFVAWPKWVKFAFFGHSNADFKFEQKWTKTKSECNHWCQGCECSCSGYWERITKGILKSTQAQNVEELRKENSPIEARCREKRLLLWSIKRKAGLQNKAQAARTSGCFAQLHYDEKKAQEAIRPWFLRGTAKKTKSPPICCQSTIFPRQVLHRFRPTAVASKSILEFFLLRNGRFPLLLLHYCDMYNADGFLFRVEKMMALWQWLRWTVILFPLVRIILFRRYKEKRSQREEHELPDVGVNIGQRARVHGCGNSLVFSSRFRAKKMRRLFLRCMVTTDCNKCYFLFWQQS